MYSFSPLIIHPVVCYLSFSPQPEWIKIMESSHLFRCLDDIPTSLLSTYFMPCQAGYTASQVGDDCITNTICFPFLYPCQRSRVQITLTGRNAGCLLNCFVVSMCPICAVSQNARAVKAWKKGRKYAAQNVAPQQLVMYSSAPVVAVSQPVHVAM